MLVDAVVGDVDEDRGDNWIIARPRLRMGLIEDETHNNTIDDKVRVEGASIVCFTGIVNQPCAICAAV